MNKENKILIGALLILFIALVSFNLDIMTGMTTDRSKGSHISARPCTESKAIVNPSVVPVDTKKRITITVLPGGQGIYGDGFVYEVGPVKDSRIGSTTITGACGGDYRCSETEFSIITPRLEAGNYKVKLKSQCTKQFTVEAPFKVE